MKTREDITNDPNFQTILEKAKNLEPAAKERLVAMFKNLEDMPFLSKAEEGVTFDVLKEKAGPTVLQHRGEFAQELNHNRDLIANILEDELKKD